MSSLANLQTAPGASDASSGYATRPSWLADTLTPIFLMINSLEVGGTERQFAQAVRTFREHHLPIHLGCLQKEGPFLEGLGEVDEFGLGGNLYGLQAIRTRVRLARLLRKRKIGVAHAFDFYSNLTLIPAARMARIPVVIGSHRQLGDLLTPAQFRAQLMVFRWCSRVVCNSRAAAARLSQAGLPENKIVIILNSLPPEAFAQAPPALPRTEGIFRIGMIARMNASYKNHLKFLRAAASLSQRRPNVEFLLVGDGPLRPELEHQAAELGLQGRIRFLGDRRDIPAVLASVDVSVSPSASESLSNVLLESMAAGVPVVATDVGGNSELLGDGRGLLVPADDEEAFAAGLERMVTEPELRLQVSRSAKEFVEANFSAERVGEQYRSLYAGTLASRGVRQDEIRKSGSSRATRSRIRVAFVAPSLRYVGGQAVQADLLLRNWKEDPEVSASFIPVDPRFPYGLRWIERVPFLRTLIREPLYLIALWRNLKDVDIAHVFSASYSSFLLAPLPAWFVARLRRKRTMINYRSGECRDHLQRSALARYVLSKTDVITVGSGYLMDVLREFGLESQIIPNIIDLSQFSYRVRRKLSPRLICSRGFHPYYGVDVVVRAFAEVQRSHPEAQLDLVGGGPLEGQIRDLVRQLNLSGVTFSGVASRNEIGRFYDRADIFVNASNLDNMPVSVLEAFASGTPVATTAPEGMRYIVDDGRTGLLSPPGDAGALAKNVIRLLSDPELATRLAQNAYAEADRYNWNAVRGKWLKAYLALMAGERNSEETVDRMV